jgi:hypothetical protein
MSQRLLRNTYRGVNNLTHLPSESIDWERVHLAEGEGEIKFDFKLFFTDDTPEE